MSEFIKCSKGHVYESKLNECPYCNGKKLDDYLKNLVNREIELTEAVMCYDMGPSGFRSDFDDDEEEEDKGVKLPSPQPPSCYAPQPPKFKR